MIEKEEVAVSRFGTSIILWRRICPICQPMICTTNNTNMYDIMTSKRFPHYWPFIGGNPSFNGGFHQKGSVMRSFGVLALLIHIENGRWKQVVRQKLIHIAPLQNIIQPKRSLSYWQAPLWKQCKFAANKTYKLERIYPLGWYSICRQRVAQVKHKNQWWCFTD